MTIERKGMMFVLSSPSGTGKTTLTKKLAKHNTVVDIEINGILYSAKITEKPLYDNNGGRMKS